jgi:uncharacterized protein with ParB-like and HNH nuclease domain
VAKKKIPTITPAVPYSVRDLLTSGHLYLIPSYQRAYSWDCTKNIDDFWQDLKTVILHGKSHPFGSIEANNTGKKWEWAADGKTFANHKIYSISDGQQRLTTFILCYAAYAHHCDQKRKDPTILNELKRIFFREDSTKTYYSQALILQENELQKCLDELVDGGNHPKKRLLAVRKMKEAFTSFFTKFESLKDDPERDEYFEALMDKSEIIFISSASNEFMKFEVRNNRGSKPNDLDRVKNLIELIEYRNYIKGGLKFPTRWYDSIKLLDRFGLENKEDQLLKHTMEVTFGENYGGDMYDNFKKKFWILTEKNDSAKETKLIGFCDAFDSMTSAMCEVYATKPGSPFAGSFKKFRTTSKNKKVQLKWRRNLGVIHCLLADISLRLNREGVFSTFILASYCKLKPPKVEKFIKIMHNLEKTTFRVYQVSSGLRDTRTDKAKQDHAKTSMEIYHGKEVANDRKFTGKVIPDVCDWAVEYLCEFTIKKCNRTLKILYDKIINATNAYNLSWTRYFLYHWEMKITPPLILNYDQNWFKDNNSPYEKEHIMPQRPRLESDGDKYWFRKPSPIFPDEPNFKEWINCFGNLVMSKREANRKYWTHPYLILKGDKSPWKRELYLNTSIDDWDQVKNVALRYSEWNTNTMKDRQERMARWAIRRWQLDCDCDKLPKLEPLPYLDEHSPYFKSTRKADAQKVASVEYMETLINNYEEEITRGEMEEIDLNHLKDRMGLGMRAMDTEDFIKKHQYSWEKNTEKPDKETERSDDGSQIDELSVPEVPVEEIMLKYNFPEDYYVES